MTTFGYQYRNCTGVQLLSAGQGTEGEKGKMKYLRIAGMVGGVLFAADLLGLIDVKSWIPTKTQ